MIRRGDIIQFRGRYALVIAALTSGNLIFVPIEVNATYNHRALYPLECSEDVTVKALTMGRLSALCILGRTLLHSDMKKCGSVSDDDLSEIEVIAGMELQARREENACSAGGESPLALSAGVVAGAASVWNGKRAPTHRAGV